MNEVALSSTLVDRTSSTIYVSNIRHSTPINSIFNIFSKYGPLNRCEIPENKFGKTRGFAFIEFENKLHAFTAFEDLAKQEILLDGRVLKLEWARATKLYKEDIQNLSTESKEKIMGSFSRNHNFDSRFSKKRKTPKRPTSFNGVPSQSIPNQNSTSPSSSSSQSSSSSYGSSIHLNGASPPGYPEQIASNTLSSILSSAMNSSNTIGTGQNTVAAAIQQHQQQQQQLQQQQLQLTPKKKTPTFIKKEDGSPLLSDSSPTLGNNGLIHSGLSNGIPLQSLKKSNNSVLLQQQSSSLSSSSKQINNGVPNHLVGSNVISASNPLLPIPQPPGGLSKSINGTAIAPSFSDMISANPAAHSDSIISPPSNYSSYFGIPTFQQSIDFNLNFNNTITNLSNLDLRGINISDNINQNQQSSNTLNKSTNNQNTNNQNNKNNNNNNNNNININNNNINNNQQQTIQPPQQTQQQQQQQQTIQPPTQQQQTQQTQQNTATNNAAINTNKNASQFTNQLPNTFFNNDEYLTELNASLHSIHHGGNSFNSNNIHMPISNHYFASSQDPVFVSTPPGINSFSHFSTNYSPIASFNNNNTFFNSNFN